MRNGRHMVGIWLTPHQVEVLQKEAKKHEYSMSDFIKYALIESSDELKKTITPKKCFN